MLITPARFLFNAGDTPKKWNEKMLNDDHFKVVFYEHDSMQIFRNNDIKGGVAITYRDKYNNFGAIKHFITNNKLKLILKKVREKDSNNSMSTITYSAASYRFSDKLHRDFPDVRNILSKGNEYQITNNIFEKLPDIFTDKKPEKEIDYIKFFGRSQSEGRVTKWIKSEYVEKPDNFNSYKVLLPASNGSGCLCIGFICISF
jgi:hypothetical protein